MSWKSLVDTFLAGKKREKEIEVENQSEYEEWVSELYSEIEVFVNRVNDLELEESEDRHKLFSLIGRFSDRFYELRERSEASDAPTAQGGNQQATPKARRLSERDAGNPQCVRS